MGQKFKGRVAVITGGSSGFGKETAELLIKEGAKVSLWDIDVATGVNAANALSKEGEADFQKVDVRVASEVIAAADKVKAKFGKVDMLINCAGVHQYKTGNVVETDEEEYDKIMDTNVKGIYLCCKYIIPLMPKNGGSIINLASAWGVIVSNRVPIYCASKAAVIHLTKAIALDFAPQNIRAISIAPGTCCTPMVEKIINDNHLRFGFDSADDMWESRRINHPLGRLGTAKDIADLIMFLVSDEAGWITGSSIIIDGGFTVGKSFTPAKK